MTNSWKRITAGAAFLLISFLFAGTTDEVQTARPGPSDSVPVYSQPADEAIDYDEFMNRIPLREPAHKPSWLEWFSASGREMDFG